MADNNEDLITQSLRVGVLLALAGGFMDAYSYLCRDEVFANAQTGNIVLFSINLFQGQFSVALKYLIPIFAAIAGILIAMIIQHDKKIKNIFYWHQISLIIETLILIPVYFLSESYNMLANILISFVCGIQMETFKKIHNQGIATTMCTGNLRSGTEHFYKFMQTKNRSNAKGFAIYFGIIACFILGAMLGKFVIGLAGLRAIAGCIILLFLAAVAMFMDKRAE